MTDKTQLPSGFPFGPSEEPKGASDVIWKESVLSRYQGKLQKKILGPHLSNLMLETELSSTTVLAREAHDLSRASVSLDESIQTLCPSFWHQASLVFDTAKENPEFNNFHSALLLHGDEILHGNHLEANPIYQSVSFLLSWLELLYTASFFTEFEASEIQNFILKLHQIKEPISFPLLIDKIENLTTDTSYSFLSSISNHIVVFEITCKEDGLYNFSIFNSSIAGYGLENHAHATIGKKIKYNPRLSFNGISYEKLYHTLYRICAWNGSGNNNTLIKEFYRFLIQQYMQNLSSNPDTLLLEERLITPQRSETCSISGPLAYGRKILSPPTYKKMIYLLKLFTLNHIFKQIEKDIESPIFHRTPENRSTLFILETACENLQNNLLKKTTHALYGPAIPIELRRLTFLITYYWQDRLLLGKKASLRQIKVKSDTPTLELTHCEISHLSSLAPINPFTGKQSIEKPFDSELLKAEPSYFLSSLSEFEQVIANPKIDNDARVRECIRFIESVSTPFLDSPYWIALFARAGKKEIEHSVRVLGSIFKQFAFYASHTYSPVMVHHSNAANKLFLIIFTLVRRLEEIDPELIDVGIRLTDFCNPFISYEQEIPKVDTILGTYKLVKQSECDAARWNTRFDNFFLRPQDLDHAHEIAEGFLSMPPSDSRALSYNSLYNALFTISNYDISAKTLAEDSQKSSLLAFLVAINRATNKIRKLDPGDISLLLSSYIGNGKDTPFSYYSIIFQSLHLLHTFHNDAVMPTIDEPNFNFYLKYSNSPYPPCSSSFTICIAHHAMKYFNAGRSRTFSYPVDIGPSKINLSNLTSACYASRRTQIALKSVSESRLLEHHKSSIYTKYDCIDYKTIASPAEKTTELVALARLGRNTLSNSLQTIKLLDELTENPEFMLNAHYIFALEAFFFKSILNSSGNSIPILIFNYLDSHFIKSIDSFFDKLLGLYDYGITDSTPQVKSLMSLVRIAIILRSYLFSLNSQDEQIQLLLSRLNDRISRMDFDKWIEKAPSPDERALIRWHRMYECLSRISHGSILCKEELIHLVEDRIYTSKTIISLPNRYPHIEHHVSMLLSRLKEGTFYSNFNSAIFQDALQNSALLLGDVSITETIETPAQSGNFKISSSNGNSYVISLETGFISQNGMRICMAVDPLKMMEKEDYKTLFSNLPHEFNLKSDGVYFTTKEGENYRIVERTFIENSPHPYFPNSTITQSIYKSFIQREVSPGTWIEYLPKKTSDKGQLIPNTLIKLALKDFSISKTWLAQKDFHHFLGSPEDTPEKKKIYFINKHNSKVEYSIWDDGFLHHEPSGYLAHISTSDSDLIQQPLSQFELPEMTMIHCDSTGHPAKIVMPRYCDETGEDTLTFSITEDGKWQYDKKPEFYLSPIDTYSLFDTFGGILTLSHKSDSKKTLLLIPINTFASKKHDPSRYALSPHTLKWDLFDEEEVFKKFTSQSHSYISVELIDKKICTDSALANLQVIYTLVGVRKYKHALILLRALNFSETFASSAIRRLNIIAKYQVENRESSPDLSTVTLYAALFSEHLSTKLNQGSSVKLQNIYLNYYLNQLHNGHSSISLTRLEELQVIHFLKRKNIDDIRIRDRRHELLTGEIISRKAVPQIKIGRSEHPRISALRRNLSELPSSIIKLDGKDYSEIERIFSSLNPEDMIVINEKSALFYKKAMETIQQGTKQENEILLEYLYLFSALLERHEAHPEINLGLRYINLLLMKLTSETKLNRDDYKKIDEIFDSFKYDDKLVFLENSESFYKKALATIYKGTQEEREILLGYLYLITESIDIAEIRPEKNPGLQYTRLLLGHFNITSAWYPSYEETLREFSPIPPRPTHGLPPHIPLLTDSDQLLQITSSKLPLEYIRIQSTIDTIRRRFLITQSDLKIDSEPLNDPLYEALLSLSKSDKSVEDMSTLEPRYYKLMRRNVNRILERYKLGSTWLQAPYTYELKKSDTAEIIEEIEVEATTLKQVLSEKKEELLKIANKISTEEADHLADELLLLSTKARKFIDIPLLIRLFVSRNSMYYQACNDHLTRDDIQVIFIKTIEYMTLSIAYDQCSRLISSAKAIQADNPQGIVDWDETLKQSMKYDPNSEPALLALEFATHKMARVEPDQIKMIAALKTLNPKLSDEAALLSATELQSICYPMIAGGGKSSFVAPVLLLEAILKGEIPHAIVPGPQYISFIQVMKKILQESCGIEIISFNFTRSELTVDTLVYIEFLLDTIKLGPRFDSPKALVLKKEMIKILALEFLSTWKELIEFPDKAHLTIQSIQSEIIELKKSELVNAKKISELEEKFDSLTLRLETSRSNLLTKFKLLQNILTIIGSTQPIGDETHIILDILNEVNFPSGPPSKIEKSLTDIIDKILLSILSESTYTADGTLIASLVRLAENMQAHLSEKDYQTRVLPAIGGYLADFFIQERYLPHIYKDAYIEYITGAIPANVERYVLSIPLSTSDGEIFNPDDSNTARQLTFIRYLHSLTAAEETKKNADFIAFSKHIMLELIPSVFQSTGLIEFGPIKKADQPGYVGPYISANTPATTEFGYEYEAYIKFIMSGFQNNIDIDLFKSYTTMLHDDAMLFVSDRMPYDETPGAREFKELTTYQLSDRENPEIMKRALEYLNTHSSKHKLQIISWAAHRYISVYPERFCATSVFLIELLKSMRTFTGTPWVFDSLHRKIVETKLDTSASLTSGKVLKKTIDTAQPHSVSILPSTSPKEYLLSILSAHPHPNKIRSLADPGGINKYSESNLAVAIEILNVIKTMSLPIKAVFFFHKKQGDSAANYPALLLEPNSPPIFITIPCAEEYKKHGLNPEDVFTYFDEPHCYGTDAPIPPNSESIVLIDNNRLSELDQTFLRQRKYLYNQSAIIAIPKHYADRLPKIEVEGESLPIETLLERGLTKHVIVALAIDSIAIQTKDAGNRAFQSMKKQVDAIFLNIITSYLKTTDDLSSSEQLKRHETIFSNLKSFLILIKSNDLFKLHGPILSEQDAVKQIKIYVNNKFKSFLLALTKIDSRDRAILEEKAYLEIEQFNDFLSQPEIIGSLPTTMPMSVTFEQRSDVSVGIGTELTVEVEVEEEREVEVEVEIDQEIQRQLEIYNKGIDTTEAYGDPLTTSELRKLIELFQLEAKPLNAASRDLSGGPTRPRNDYYHLSEILTPSTGLIMLPDLIYRDDFSGIFEHSQLYATRDFLFPRKGKEGTPYQNPLHFPIFSDCARKFENILVVQISTTDQYRYIALSTLEGERIQKYLRENSHSGVWLTTQYGAVIAGIGYLSKEHERGKNERILINLLAGDMSYLLRNVEITDRFMTENERDRIKKESMTKLMRFTAMTGSTLQLNIFEKMLNISKTRHELADTHYQIVLRAVAMSRAVQSKEEVRLLTEEYSILALHPTQVQFLETEEQIDFLHINQIPYLVASQARFVKGKDRIQALSAEAIKGIALEQVEHLTNPSCITSIPAGHFAYLSKATFNVSYVKFLSASQVSEIQDISLIQHVHLNLISSIKSELIQDYLTHLQDTGKFKPNILTNLTDDQLIALNSDFLIHLSQARIATIESPELIQRLTKEQAPYIQPKLSCHLKAPQIDSTIPELFVPFIQKELFHFLTINQIKKITDVQIASLSGSLEFLLLVAPHIFERLPESIKLELPDNFYKEKLSSNYAPFIPLTLLTRIKLPNMTAQKLALPQLIYLGKLDERNEFAIHALCKQNDLKLIQILDTASNFTQITKEKIESIIPKITTSFKPIKQFINYVLDNHPELIELFSIDYLATADSESVAKFNPSIVNRLPILRYPDLTAEQLDMLTIENIQEIRDQALLQKLSPRQFSHLKPDQVQSVTLNQLPVERYPELTSVQLDMLEPIKVTQIQDQTVLQKLSASQLNHLSPAQIESIRDATLINRLPLTRYSDLTSEQLGVVTPENIQQINDRVTLQKLPLSQVLHCSTAEQFNHLTIAQIQSITDATLINRLPLRRYSDLTSEQLGVVTPENIQQINDRVTLQKLPLSQVLHCSTAEQFNHLTLAQIQSITDATLINRLPLRRYSDLTSEQLDMLTTENLQQIETQEIFTKLSINKLNSLSHRQVSILSIQLLQKITNVTLINQLAMLHSINFTPLQFSMLDETRVKEIINPNFLVKLIDSKLEHIDSSLVNYLSREKIRFLKTKEQIRNLNPLKVTYINPRLVSNLSALQKTIYSIEIIGLFVLGIIAYLPTLILAAGIARYSNERALQIRYEAKHAITQFPETIKSILTH